MLKRNPNRTKPYAQLRSKPPEQGKPRKAMNRVGKSSRSKQNQSWDKELKAEWATKGITRCEKCNGTFALNLAHSKKRRYVLTKEDYWEVALLCQNCHDDLEFGGHERMEAEVKRIIRERDDRNEQDF